VASFDRSQPRRQRSSRVDEQYLARYFYESSLVPGGQEQKAGVAELSFEYQKCPSFHRPRIEAISFARYFGGGSKNDEAAGPNISRRIVIVSERPFYNQSQPLEVGDVDTKLWAEVWRSVAQETTEEGQRKRLRSTGLLCQCRVFLLRLPALLCVVHFGEACCLWRRVTDGDQPP